ncbi:hypothetical protein F2Q70_00019447 [Brassica cretica]|uniref:Uncharacterized protein n=1 Tax=Brassica cretica TaxID=69181 RepID=A0A8S9GPI9_BRACR|nr:hypothetical protein F2Q70_00019447 [Brassica cretica]
MTSELPPPPPPLRERPKKNEPNNHAEAALYSTQAATKENPTRLTTPSEQASHPCPQLRTSHRISERQNQLGSTRHRGTKYRDLNTKPKRHEPTEPSEHRLKGPPAPETNELQRFVFEGRSPYERGDIEKSARTRYYDLLEQSITPSPSPRIAQFKICSHCC